MYCRVDVRGGAKICLASIVIFIDLVSLQSSLQQAQFELSNRVTKIEETQEQMGNTLDENTTSIKMLKSRCDELGSGLQGVNVRVDRTGKFIARSHDYI